MTWILMEIPCHFMSQIDGSLVQIHTKFHDYSMTFNQFLFIFHEIHDMDFGQVQVMEFSWHFLRNDGISIEFDAIFDQTPVKKTRENPRHIFYRDNQSGITLFDCKYNTGICAFIY